MAYRVLIVDDQIIPRQLLESFISSSDNYELAASIDTAKYADSYCAGGGIDLVVMDVVMNDGSNGLESAKRIKNSYPDIKVIIMTQMPDSLFLKRAREIGVDSFWYKEVQQKPMLEVMDRTMAGEHIFPDAAPTVKIGLAESSDFTERELEVLRLLADGYTDMEIAEELNIKLPTVRFHISNMITKTGHSSRTELAVNAVRSGIAVARIQ